MATEFKVVRASNENQVLLHGSEDDCKDYVERNFPRHHVDPASPVMEEAVADVYVVGPGGQKEQYLGPESDGGWAKVGKQNTGGKVS